MYVKAQGFLERALRTRTGLFHRSHPCIAPCRANLGDQSYRRAYDDRA